MNQLLLGAFIPFAVAALVYACRGFRASLALLTVTPVAMLATAAWAVAPDLPRFIGRHDWYLRLARDSRIDIFLWHYTIDGLEVDSPWYAAGVALLFAALLAVAWRELRRTEGETAP